MRRVGNQAVIGAFILGAVVLGVAAVVLLSGDRLFRQGETFIAYFDGSLDGLDVGAPVTFNGVRIGSVSDLSVVIDGPDGALRTPVVFTIYRNRLRDGQGARLGGPNDVPKLEVLIRRGLRARLELQSLVTGQLEVALNFYPGSPVRLTGLSKHYPEMPTIPSSFEQLTRRLENLPLEALVSQTTQTMRSIEALATAPEVKSALVKLDRALDGVDGVVREVRGQIGPLVASVQGTAAVTQTTMAEAQRTLAEARAAIAQLTPPAAAAIADYQALARDAQALTRDGQALVHDARQAVARADAQIEAVSVSLRTTLADAHDVLRDDSPVRYDLANTLNEMTRAARSLRTLAEFLDQHPDALLVGKRREAAP